MKKYFRLTTILIVILALLLPTFPASAGATKSYFVGEIANIIDLEDDPDLRTWAAGHFGFTVTQVRNQTQYMDFVVTEGDARFAGYNVAEYNNRFHFDAEGNLISAQTTYKSITYQNDVPLWRCSSVGHFDIYWNIYLEGVCQGLGIYQSLTAKFVSYNTPDWSKIVLEGYIIEP